MKNRAQSALEYMMTYGWAILIIVIVAAVLYSLGIFNPSANAGTTSTGFSPFTVLAQACGSSGLAIQLGNNAGSKVGITGATVQTSSGITSLTTTQNATSTGLLISGAAKIIGFAGVCSTGSRYSATINIAYNETTSLGTQDLVATGTVSGTGS